MLREIEGVADQPRMRRRWFHDDYFDLFVWQTDAGDITLFQLCYGADAAEHALVWHKDGGFFHDGGPARSDPIITRFEAAAQTLPRKVRSVVGQCIREYAQRKLPVESRRKRFRREEWQNAAQAPRSGAVKQ